MRFSTIAIVASIVAAASAVDYPFKPNGACVQTCLDSVGKDMNPNFTSDPNSPYFMESLSYAHDRGTPKYITYMTKTGMCISKCPQDQLDLYNAQYQAKADWYAANKNGGTAASGSATAPAPSTTSGTTPKPTGAASGVSASLGLVGAAAVGAAVLLF
ncbi:hypothetical protein EMPS_09488 [Entomortierella parvispora]|uniref:Uncharacterized protein n=1 Tax=Entomortierella parvispora TaxID=205924 RepID=A0A9P3HI31_9FUNG|nr:hypothetical protein EMPS_09488 [Entomortierella parvispora]